MLKIFKYPVEITDEFELEMPTNATILKAECQHGYDRAYMWAMADTSESLHVRRFRVAGTGHPIGYEKHELNHISTFQMASGRLVFHLFEIKRDQK